MKYDDASWHYGGDFPKDLPIEAGGTHIGMFLAAAVMNGLEGELHAEDFAEELGQLKRREVTPGVWFMENCDGKLTDEDFNVEGNEFAELYFGADNAKFFRDYAITGYTELESIYHVPDTWETFDKIAPLVTEAIELLRRTRS